MHVCVCVRARVCMCVRTRAWVLFCLYDRVQVIKREVANAIATMDILEINVKHASRSSSSMNK